MQYVGSTITKFRTRFNNYKSKHRKFRENYLEGVHSEVEQKIFHQHYCQGEHIGEDNWSIKLIDKSVNLPKVRRKERFWQHKLNTFYPIGLNEKEVPLIYQ